MSGSLPPLNFLTSPSRYWDYRPAVGPGGDAVVFERTLQNQNYSTLYVITDFASKQAAPLLTGSSLPRSQTRPDWFWGELGDGNEIVFNGSQNNKSPVDVWKAGLSQPTPLQLPSTQGYAYPTWGNTSWELVVKNGGTNANPSPCNWIISPDNGSVIATNINGVLPRSNTKVFGGMPAARRGSAEIAFAGQPAITHWGGSPSPQPEYDEELNYIILNEGSGFVGYSSSPLEPGASLTSFDPAHQGRAPAWSPDGKTVALESNRAGGGYAIYLFNRSNNVVTQVTDPTLNGQHAKFFPSGGKLILAIRQSATSPLGIAWVDISGLL